jgi:hypothetical protein
MKRGIFWLAVISHARPNNVARTTKRIGQATWYVGSDPEEIQAYQYTGAASVIGSGALCRSRNAALEDAFSRGLVCVQVSDDMARCCHLKAKNSEKLVRPTMPFTSAVNMVWDELEHSPYYLGGGAPNDFIAWDYYNKPVVNAAFILGDFMVIKPNPLRFDETLPLKEDYDYTCQHLKAYGGVVRCNRVMVDFEHRSKLGGVFNARDAGTELQAIQRLKEKWGDWIKPNPRSQYEVLFNGWT